MAAYEFITLWRFTAPLPSVWDVIHDAISWPRWWKAVESVVELDPGDEKGLGALHRYTWRGVLPYRLRFDMKTTLVEEPVRLEGEASGDLVGTGRWRLSEEGSDTVVRYDWRVETSKRWMRALTPVARPLFAWNHDVVMRWGREGLSGRLRTGAPDR
jgi:hypothetical protein